MTTIEKLLLEGKTASAPHVKMIYKVEDSKSNPGITAYYSVPKRNFKRAVDRNLLKRRMRAAFGKCSLNLIEKCRDDNKTMVFMFIYKGKVLVPYMEIESSFGLILPA